MAPSGTGPIGWHAWLLAALLAAGMPAGRLTADDSAQPSATLFGQPIRLEDIRFSVDRELAAEELKAWRLDEAQKMIWQALVDHFCETHACEPTEDDYAAFEAGVKRASAGRPQPSGRLIPEDEYQRLRIELLGMIQTSADEKERIAAQDALVKLEQLHSMEAGAVSRDVARAMIRAWKFNKAIHAEYGGTVIWQQIGLEPVGAYEAWLKEHEAKGSFAIHDPELAERFWRYFKIEHLVVDDDFLKSAGLTHPFEKPWWLMDPPPDAQPVVDSQEGLE